MKKFFFVFTVVASSFGMLNAQNAKTPSTTTEAATVAKAPEVKAKELVAQINNSVQLQGDQWGKVNDLCIDFFTKADALRAKKETLDAKMFETKLSELRTNRDKTLSGILTPEQNRKLEAAKAADKAKN